MIRDLHVGLMMKALAFVFLAVPIFLLPRESSGGVITAKAPAFSAFSTPFEPSQKMRKAPSLSSPRSTVALATVLMSATSKDDETFGCHHPRSGALPAWECGKAPTSVLLHSGPFAAALPSLHPVSQIASIAIRSFESPQPFPDLPSDSPDRPPTLRNS